VQNAEWRCLHAEKDSLIHQGREISASHVLEIIAISIIFQWKFPRKKGAVTLHFSEILVPKIFLAQSLFSLAQYLHYSF
jgi:hypothetical protein